MKTKRRELAPVGEPWRLLRDALDDLEAQEGVPGVVIDMARFHEPRDGVCHQCLAGTVMARRLGAHDGDHRVPYDYDDSIANRLNALDEMRIGRVHWAYRFLRLDKPDSLPDKVPVPRYEDDRDGFFSALRGLADAMEAAHQEEAS